MPTAPASWKHDWTCSGLKIGSHCGRWFVPNATFPQPPKHVRGQRLNKRKLEFAKLLRLPGRAKKAERWQRHEMRRQYLSPGEIVQEIKSLYPVDPEPAVPSTARVSFAFTAEVMDFIPITLKRMPRLTGPGLLGMCAEHCYDFGTQAGDSDLFAPIIAHIATATIPDAVLQYLRAGQVTPLAKPTGGHRPLLMMSFLRRLALKAGIAAKKTSITDAVGPLQHGVGCKDGANKMIKSIQYFAEADQTRVLVALDFVAAFQNVSISQMLHSLSQHDPDLATVFSRWYTGFTTHRMHHDGFYTHTYKPAAESTWAALCNPAALRPRSTPSHDTFSPKRNRP